MRTLGALFKTPFYAAHTGPGAWRPGPGPEPGDASQHTVARVSTLADASRCEQPWLRHAVPPTNNTLNSCDTPLGRAVSLSISGTNRRKNRQSRRYVRVRRFLRRFVPGVVSGKGPGGMVSGKGRGGR